MRYKIGLQVLAALFIAVLIFFNVPYMIDVYLLAIAATAIGVYYFFIKK